MQIQKNKINNDVSIRFIMFYSRCSHCKKDSNNLVSGLCISCYNQKHRNKGNQRRLNREWHKRNPQYWNDYYQKNKEKLNAYQKERQKLKRKNKNE